MVIQCHTVVKNQIFVLRICRELKSFKNKSEGGGWWRSATAEDTNKLAVNVENPLEFSGIEPAKWERFTPIPLLPVVCWKCRRRPC